MQYSKAFRPCPGPELVGQHLQHAETHSYLLQGGFECLLWIIDAKLSIYENLREALELLELGIPNDDIVQRILSYF